MAEILGAMEHNDRSYALIKYVRSLTANGQCRLLNQICAYLLDVVLVRGPTYSVAFAKGIPMKVGLSVSVYISIPVPRR